MRRLGRGSILIAVLVLVGIVMLRPTLFDDDGSSGTRGLPRARAGESGAPARSTSTPLSSTSTPGAAQADASATPVPGSVLATFERLSSQLEANPNDSAAWIELGDLLLQEQDYARAAEAFAAATEASATDPVARARLGKALLMEGMVRVARGELLRALAIDPSQAEAQLNLGITYSHAAPADLEAARVAWTRAAVLAPGSEIAKQAEAYLAAYAEPQPTPTATPGPSR